MTQSELLQPLVGAIKTVQQRIQDYRDEYTNRETFTRISLIDPVLSALGWTVSDPSLVRPEFTVKTLRPDYVLFKVAAKGNERDILATVEAKALNIDVLSVEGQTLQQVLQADVRHAVLTNGDRWLVYDVTKPTMAERRIVDVQLSKLTAAQAALGLLVLWRPNLEEGTPVQAQRPIVGELGKSNKPPIPESSPAPDQVPPGDEWVALSDFDPKSGSSLPSHILFPGNRQRELKHWRSFVDEVTQWLFDSKKLTSANVPFSYGKSGTGIVNSSPTMRNRKNMLSYYQVPSQEIFVDAHGNAPTVVGRARAILLAREVDSSTVYVKPR